MERSPSAAAAARAFFAARAAGWETRFPDDGPVYRAAVAELAPPAGTIALDAGCGTARATPLLRDAVGPRGLVLALDATWEMLAEARALGRADHAHLVGGDACSLPLLEGCIDSVFAAGLVPHLPDPAAGLRELARVTRSSGRLAVFHPISRAALAARHGRTLDPGDVMAPGNFARILERSGWQPLSIDDSAERYLALAARTSHSPGAD